MSSQISEESGLIDLIKEKLYNIFASKYNQINEICQKAYHYEKDFSNPNREMIKEAFGISE